MRTAIANLVLVMRSRRRRRQDRILVTVDADQLPDLVTADIQARLAGLSRPGGA